MASTKPPKLRFRPGNFVEFRGALYEVMGAYRLKADPHEWLFLLSARQDMHSGFANPSKITWEPVGALPNSVSLVYDVIVSNQNLLQGGKLLSSGPIAESPGLEKAEKPPEATVVIDVTPPGGLARALLQVEGRVLRLPKLLP